MPVVIECLFDYGLHSLMSIMVSRYALGVGEEELWSAYVNGSPGKFSIWWSLFTLGLQRKELHSGWIIFTNHRLVFCKRHWLKQYLLDILQPLIRSKRILWEVALDDIECIQARQCLGIYPFHRVQTNRLSGDYYDFGCREKNIKPLCDRLKLDYRHAL